MGDSVFPFAETDEGIAVGVADFDQASWLFLMKYILPMLY